MKKKFSMLIALVLAVSLLMVPVAVSASLGWITLSTYGDGGAQWSTDQAKTGLYSVKLDAGTAGGSAAGRIEIEVPPIPIANFTGATFFVWEPAGTQHGGEYPATTGDPYGDPYINILLDLDGNGVWDDCLEGLGSVTVGTIVEPGVTHPTPATETWVEMEEGYGFYDMDDSMGSDLMEPYIWPIVVQSLEDWKDYLAPKYPDAQVVGIKITFGFWADEVTLAVYVDDVTIHGFTYNLEAPSGSTQLHAYTQPPQIGISVDPPFVDFGPLIPGEPSAPWTITVTNEGTVAADFSATLANISAPDVYTTGLQIDVGLVDAWEALGVEVDGFVVPNLVLTVPDGTPPGSHTATLIFWAEAAP